MLSAIHPVNLPQSTSPSPNTSSVPPDRSSSSSSLSSVSATKSPAAAAITSTAAASTAPIAAAASARCGDMSRRKQRNPKPFFNAGDDHREEADDDNDVASHVTGRDAIEERTDVLDNAENEESPGATIRKDPDGEKSKSDDGGGDDPSPRDEPAEDLTSFVKVEVREEDEAALVSNPSTTASPPATSPPNDGGLPSLVPFHALPQLTPMPGAATSQKKQTFPPQPKPEMEEMLAKNNMLYFGDVQLAEQHPDILPVPVIVPMAYLMPIAIREPAEQGGRGCLRYKMFVPANAPVVPDIPPPIPAPGLSRMQPSPTLPPLNINIPAHGAPHPELKRQSISPATATHSNKGVRKDTAESPSNKKDQNTIPLDLSKETIDEVRDGRRSASSLSVSPDGIQVTKQQKEIEAHLNFLKAKHLELLKSQHEQQEQQQQQLQQPPQPESRCEECNINFSKHQNYVAHKKYYCSGGLGCGGPKPKESSGGGKHAANKAAGSTQARKADKMPPGSNAAAPMAAALGLLGLTPPPAGTTPADLLFLKQHQEMLLKSEAALQALGHHDVPSPASLLLAGSRLQQLPSPPLAQASTTTQTTSGNNTSNSSKSKSVSPLSHFVCDGCGIKFKSVSNLQAHQARYCAGLRKENNNDCLMNNAFEAIIKQQQPVQQQHPFAGLSAAEMMSFLSAKSIEHRAKMSNASSSTMAPTPTISSASLAEDFCCILCGYKEQSVERLKDHINMHFISQVKKSGGPEQKSAGNAKRSLSSTSSSASSSSSLSPRNQEDVAHSNKKRTSTDNQDVDPKKENQSNANVDSPLKKRLKLEFKSATEDGDHVDDGNCPSSPSPAPSVVRSQSPAAQTGAGTAEANIRCESCDIGFAHLSNFVAHKKYYCRGHQLLQQKQANGKVNADN